MLRKFRKPLIIFTPKSLLRKKEAVSTLDEMSSSSRFQKVIAEGNGKNIDKIVFCSGKIYYDIQDKINNDQSNSILIIRLEQLYPFPGEIIADKIKDYKHARFFWCQEEPKNMGAWSFIFPKLRKLILDGSFTHQHIKYVGREDSASTATGLFRKHIEEQNNIIESLINN